jgi:RNA ligase (TIGR02306 family)
MRKLATVRFIHAIDPIPGADAIEVATLGGWKVVVKKGEFEPGDLAVYLEIDSWVPTQLAPFLSKGKEPRVFDGILGERLRTVRLRGQLSQGLLLPYAVLGRIAGANEDVSQELGIVKYEPPIDARLAGLVKGPFPGVIPKTDQERMQNLTEEIAAAVEAGLKFEVTEKLEGSSMTCYMIDGEFGVCSRNLDLKPDANNTLWAVAQSNSIEAKMRAVDEHWSWAIQGELIGPGIQNNIYRLSKHEFRVFDVYDIQTGKYLPPKARRDLIERMDLKHVPVLLVDKDLGVGVVEDILIWADDQSRLNEKQTREGIVFKQADGGMTFKAISNRYLLGEK